MDKETKDELHKIETLLVDLSKQVNSIGKAFPTDEVGNIDADGHRKYHEALIRSAKLQEEFWRDLRGDLLRKGIWAVILIVVGLAVTGLTTKLGVKL